MASEVKKIYEFGGFRFDAKKLRLEYDGEPVQLPPKSLETLKVLLEEKGEIITRENFLGKIWSKNFVEDANLTVAISTLRKTLAAYEKEQNFIQTVPRRGYRFVGEAREKIEVLEQPIVIEHHAVERLTLEETSLNTFSRSFIIIALIVLIAFTAVSALWLKGDSAALSAQNFKTSAREAFEKGDALMQNRLTVCDSISYYREAIAKDETHDRAHANLAAALAMCNDPGKEADALVARALTLAPNSAEAHATDGFIKLFLHLDWDAAEKALRRAVVLDPNSAKAHHWLGILLSIRGRFLESAGEIRRAVEIEPNSPLYYADLCQVYYFERDFPRAITECQKAQEIDPNFIFTTNYLRDIYLLANDGQKAWEYEAKHLLMMQFPPESIEEDKEVFRRESFKGLYKNRNRYLLEQIKNGNPDAKNRINMALNLAKNYALLRDRENTLKWLEQVLVGEKEDYPFAAAYIRVEPRYAFLRGEPRFQAILKKMNLAN